MDSKLILLNYQIEYVRNKLYKALLSKGMTDKKVINYSHQLDRLLNEYLSTSLSLHTAA
jgi:hypothetical protein